MEPAWRNIRHPGKSRHCRQTLWIRITGSDPDPHCYQNGSNPVWSPGSGSSFSKILDNLTNIYWISVIWLFRLKDVDIDWERGKFLGIRSGFCKSQSGSANLRHDLYQILGKNTWYNGSRQRYIRERKIISELIYCVSKK